MGKTDLLNFLHDFFKTCNITVLKVSDALCVLEEHINKYGWPENITLDIPRATSVDNIYTLLEIFKSKKISSSKYNSKTLEVPDILNVFVFSNTHPDIEKVTKDRWCILIPNFDNETISYAFTGHASKLILDKLKDLEEKKVIKASKALKYYEECFPIEQIFDIDWFPRSMEILSQADRKKYWDAYYIPRIVFELTPQGNVMKIQAIPMTQEEKDKYNFILTNGYNKLVYEAKILELEEKANKALEDFNTDNLPALIQKPLNIIHN